MIFKRIILAFLLAVFSSSFLFAQDDKAAAESDQQISEFSLAGYGDKGKKSWELAGKSADIFTDTVKLNDVVGKLYGKEEDVKLTAQKGDFNKNDGKVHLEKDVVITTTSGTKLTTDSLDWDRKDQVVTTKDKVNIERENMITSGTGAVGKMALSQVKLERDVKVDILPQAKEGKIANPNDKIVITCEGPMEVDYEKNIATFSKNVKVERPDSTIYSDKLDIYFIPSSKNKAEDPKVKEAASKEEDTSGFMGSSIDKVVARGNVKVVRGENISYSEEAIYSSTDKKLILTGRPKLVIYSTEAMSAPIGD